MDPCVVFKHSTVTELALLRDTARGCHAKGQHLRAKTTSPQPLEAELQGSTHRPLSSSFLCSYLESYKVIPKRNYLGA